MVLGGRTGRSKANIPKWYVIHQVASHYGVSPHVVETEWPFYWVERALIAISAETKAKVDIEKRNRSS